MGSIFSIFLIFILFYFYLLFINFLFELFELGFKQAKCLLYKQDRTQIASFNYESSLSAEYPKFVRVQVKFEQA